MKRQTMTAIQNNPTIPAAYAIARRTKRASKAMLAFVVMAMLAGGAFYIRTDDLLLFNTISLTVASIACGWFVYLFDNGRRWVALFAMILNVWYAVAYITAYFGFIDQFHLIAVVRPATNFYGWLPVWFFYAFEPLVRNHPHRKV